MSNKPVVQTRDRLLSVSIFSKEREENGRTQIVYGACLQRSYQPKDSQEWKQEQINLYPDELLKVSNLCLNAYNGLTKYAQSQRQDRQETRQYPAASYNDPTPSYGEPPAYLNDDIPFA